MKIKVLFLLSLQFIFITIFTVDIKRYFQVLQARYLEINLVKSSLETVVRGLLWLE